MCRGNMSPTMLRRRIRFMTKITLIWPLIRSMVVGDHSLANHVTFTRVYPRVQRQVTLRAERFVAQRANVYFVLLRRVRKNRCGGVLNNRDTRIVRAAILFVLLGHHRRHLQKIAGIRFHVHLVLVLRPPVFRIVDYC